jgi:DNA-directed RNA polymerase subunit RPC12/RpoP
MATRSHLYTCVNCGNQVQELFKQYSPSVLKLVHCVCEIPRGLFHDMLG